MPDSFVCQLCRTIGSKTGVELFIGQSLPASAQMAAVVKKNAFKSD